MESTTKQVYGYVNGRPVYSRDEFIFTARGFGAIEQDEQLLEYAKKVTSNWYNAGWHHKFEHFYLSDYALAEPRSSLTDREFKRLKELQRTALEAEKRREEAREWRLTETNYYADNSTVETWTDKDGNKKDIVIVGPHGDAC